MIQMLLQHTVHILFFPPIRQMRPNSRATPVCGRAYSGGSVTAHTDLASRGGLEVGDMLAGALSETQMMLRGARSVLELESSLGDGMAWPSFCSDVLRLT